MADDFNFDFTGSNTPPAGEPPAAPPVPADPQQPSPAPDASAPSTYPGNQAPQYQQGANPPPASPTAPYMPPVQQPPYPQQPYAQQQPPYQQPYPPVNTAYNPQPAYIPPPVPVMPEPGRGLAIGSLVLGILSVVCCSAWYVSVVLALIGLVLGIIAKSKGNGGMATAGIVLSAIGLALTALMAVFAIVAWSSYEGDIWNWIQEFYSDVDDSGYYTAIRGFFHR